MSGPMPLSSRSRSNGLIENHSVNNDAEILRRVLKLIHQQPNKLNTAFFSKKNIDDIQNAVKKDVFIRSGKKHVISRQSDEQLLIIMQSVFINNTYNIEVYIENQIGELNRIVVKECTKIIMPNIEQFIGYLDNIDKPVIPMAYGKATSSAGEKTVSFLRNM